MPAQGCPYIQGLLSQFTFPTGVHRLEGFDVAGQGNLIVGQALFEIYPRKVAEAFYGNLIPAIPVIRCFQQGLSFFSQRT